MPCFAPYHVLSLWERTEGEGEQDPHPYPLPQAGEGFILTALSGWWLGINTQSF